MQRKPQKTSPKPKCSASTLSLRTVEGKILTALREGVAQGLGQTDQTNLFNARGAHRARITVGFSGGRDSVALLKSLCVLRDKRTSPIEAIEAIHVHHALSPNANKWARFCRRMAEDLGVEFKVVYVRVKKTGDGVEAAARKARYEALFKAAHAARDVKEESVRLVRPLMHLPRALLERYLELYQLGWVEDESNADTAYLRNGIRHEVLPVMETIRPGFKEAAARSVELVAQTAQVLGEIAQEDLQKIQTTDRDLSITSLTKLSVARQALVIRAWIESFGLLVPSKAKLDEILRQASLTGNDTKLKIKAGTNMEIRRHAGKLVMRATAGRKTDKTRFETLDWTGPGHYSLAAWGGELVITEVTGDEAGVPESFFKEKLLQVRPRQGGEKLKLYRNRPRKHLKDLYQKAGIAEFDRPNLPLLWSGEDLLFAAGLGMDVRVMTDDSQLQRFKIEWKPDATLLTLMQS